MSPVCFLEAKIISKYTTTGNWCYGFEFCGGCGYLVVGGRSFSGNCGGGSTSGKFHSHDDLPL